MRVPGGCWFSRYKHAIVLVASDAVTFNLFLKCAQPFSYQVNVLEPESMVGNPINTISLLATPQ